MQNGTLGEFRKHERFQSKRVKRKAKQAQAAKQRARAAKPVIERTKTNWTHDPR
jgi:ribosomal protein S21